MKTPPDPRNIPPDGQLAWDILVQLRDEILSLQRIRAQLVTAKVAVVSAAVGAVAAYSKDIGGYVWVWLTLAAVAAICFDILIESYSFSIKRTGRYIREHLEPVIRSTHSWPASQPLWEEYLCQVPTPHIFKLGSCLLTLLVSILALVSIWHPSTAMQLHWRIVLSAMLLILLSIDYCAFRQSTKLEGGPGNGSKPSE